MPERAHLVELVQLERCCHRRRRRGRTARELLAGGRWWERRVDASLVLVRLVRRCAQELEVRRAERLLELETRRAQLLLLAAVALVAAAAASVLLLLVDLVLVLVLVLRLLRVCVRRRAMGGGGGGEARDAVEIGAGGRSELEEGEHVAHRRQERGARDVGRVCGEAGAQEGLEVRCFRGRLGRRRLCERTSERTIAKRSEQIRSDSELAASCALEPTDPNRIEWS